MDKLTWLVIIFDNVKGGGKGRECKGLALLRKKWWETNLCKNVGDSGDT